MSEHDTYLLCTQVNSFLMEPEVKLFQAAVDEIIRMAGEGTSVMHEGKVYTLANKPMQAMSRATTLRDEELMAAMTTVVASRKQAEKDVRRVMQGLAAPISAGGINGLPENLRSLMGFTPDAETRPFADVLNECHELEVLNWKNVEKTLAYLISLRMVI